MLLLASLLLSNVLAKIKQANLAESNHFCPELPLYLPILYPSTHDYSGSSFLAISAPGSAGYFRATLLKTISKVFMVHQWHALPWVGLTVLTSVARAAM